MFEKNPTQSLGHTAYLMQNYLKVATKNQSDIDFKCEDGHGLENVLRTVRDSHCIIVTNCTGQPKGGEG